MTNHDFNLAELLRTMHDIDKLDEPIIRVDDPPPGENIPLDDENLEDDPIIRIDDPVDPEPGGDVPIEDPYLEDAPVIIDDPVDPEPGEDVPIEGDPAVTEYWPVEPPPDNDGINPHFDEPEPQPTWYPCDEAEAPVEPEPEPEPQGVAAHDGEYEPGVMY